MAETSGQFKPKPRRKAAPVRHITPSAETREAYEALLRERAERDRLHTRFLPEEHKTRR
jgi:hypothetical protein